MHRGYSSRLTLVLVISATTLAWGFGGCSSTPKSSSTDKKVLSNSDEQIFLGDTIEKNYDPNVIMKRGEAFYEKEEFPEAIVEYQHFLDLHRSHLLASYAQFRMAESHLRIAKSIDRDPDPIYKAIGAFEKLRKDFPGSRYDAQALQRLDECHSWLAQTHLFVGQFYFRRESYLAAAHRFDQIMKDYSDKPVAPEALYYLALSYKEMGANDWASEKLMLLAEKYPTSEVAKDGKRLLAKLQRTPSASPAPVVAQSPDQAQAIPSAGNLLADNTTRSALALPSAGRSAAVETSSTASLSQRFVSCRLGAWC
ncbi:MAG TPA: outer membrane protein assembly factor BamD [Nitrospiraceae bacterium]|nr:outer membrane protein assembly factor BamD [Nitrospiraceae bacterium]